MSIILRYLILVWFNTFVYIVLSQNTMGCGTDILFDQKQWQASLLKKNKVNKSLLSDSTVPVKFHFISYSDSTETTDSTIAFNELSISGEYFKNAGIIFKHCGNIDYIYDDEFASFEKLKDELICNQRDFPNVINIYFLPELFKEENGSSIEFCGYTYLNGTKNRVLINNSCLENSTTLAHELGHYFSLLHTHEIMYGIEYVNGSNCDETGDFFCDTPADPGLNINNTLSNCVYIGQELDPLGQGYYPSTENIMSYNPYKTCRDEFSIEQLQQVDYFFRSNSNKLHCIYDTELSYLASSFDLILFPNPVKNFLALTANIPNDAIVEIIVSDVLGKIMINKTISNFSYVGVSELAIGSYYFTLKYNQQLVTKQFIKY